ncbi:hypothetical protein N8314_01785 [Akkermansiaceae bacterium]|jgi:hypothetical protein|nr:hypothetical protein [Akkermansiaceae bacterium]
MTEELKVINIDNTPYLIDDISDSCKEMLNTAQQTNAAIGMMGTLIQAAQKGADLNFKEAVKLLPEPYKVEEPESSETH